MRNVWIFIYKNGAFFWFLAFELLAFYFIFKFNPYQGGIYLNTSNRIVGGIYLQRSRLTSYLDLKNTNIALAKENIILREELQSSKYQSKAETKKIIDTANQQEFNYVIAHIVNNSTTKRNNYLTLDRGQLDGIKPGDAVIFPNGILGVIKDADTHFSVAISILHSDSRVSVRIRHRKNLGSLLWDGVNSQNLTVKDIPNYVEVKKGDTIETSGFSLYPSGIPIGTITSFGVHNGEVSLSIQIKLLADLNNIDIAYIVRDKFALEKNHLETVSEK